jgi:hypothetical protein
MSVSEECIWLLSRLEWAFLVVGVGVDGVLLVFRVGCWKSVCCCGVVAVLFVVKHLCSLR